MKRLLCALFLCASPLLADYDLEDVSGWDIDQVYENQSLQFEFEGDWVGDSKFTKDSVEGDHIRYSYLEAELEAVGYYDPKRYEGFATALSYEHVRLDWENNPFFDRKNFNTASLALLGYSGRFCRTTWLAQFKYNIDANNWGFIDYSTYDWLVWGRYHFLRNVDLHAGIYGQSGIRLPYFLPIIGFDWTCANWKFSAVFPINISLVYTLDRYWTMSLAGRWWNDRHRVGEHEHLQKAVWRYTNYGVELGIKYEHSCRLKAKFHSGCTFAGKVKVADRHGKNAETLHFKPAAYFGGELIANF